MKHFQVVTDHKPLVALYNNYKSEMSVRVQTHKLALQGRFNFTVEYQPGKDNPSDYNSRHPLPSAPSEYAEEAELRVQQVVVDAIPDALTAEEVLAATDKDEKLQLLKQAVERGYPTKEEAIHIAEYKRMMEELAVVGGIVCRADKIVLPVTLQQRVIALAHEAHMGIVKTKQFLRSTLWFPGMDAKVEEVLGDCVLCLAATNTKQKEPLKPTIMPSRPWQKLCTDLFGPLPTGEYMVVVQCLNSRYPEVAITHSTSAAAVIPAIDRILAAFGIPESLMSDNGPPFNSSEFRKYAAKLGFKHRRIIPLAPWSNGTAEKFMQSLGKVVKIAHADRKNWRHELTKFLRAYRGTPHSMTGVTPASLMFNGRPFRTTLPTIQEGEEQVSQRQAQNSDSKKKDIMKMHADKKNYVREADIRRGDKLLLAQKKQNKLTTPYEVTPYTAVSVSGSMVTANNRD